MVSTLQNVLGNMPVVALDPPPEGERAVKLSYTLTPAEYYIPNQYQLDAQNGLQLSQVVSLVIDNTQNPYPLTVVHGVLSETATIGANTQVVVATFSSRGYYPISVALATAPASNVTVDCILLNYERLSGSFSTPLTVQNSIVNTGENSGTIYSGTQLITAGGGYILGAASNWIVDSLDFSIETVTTSASGVFSVNGFITSNNIAIHSFTLNGVATASQSFPGNALTSPTYRTWPQGYLCQRGYALLLAFGAFTNISNIIFRASISGYKAL